MPYIHYYFDQHGIVHAEPQVLGSNRYIHTACGKYEVRTLHVALAHEKATCLGCVAATFAAPKRPIPAADLDWRECRRRLS